jgi:hypothetical protein
MPSQPFEVAFEQYFGLSNTGVISLSSGFSRYLSDMLWRGDLILERENHHAAFLGEPWQFWRFVSRPGITADGSIYWLGGLHDGYQGPSDDSHGLFIWRLGDPMPTTVVSSGDSLGQLQATVDSVGVRFGFSALGSRYILQVRLAAATDDWAVLVDGAPPQVGGEYLRTDRPLAMYGALTGERWTRFDSLAITESGSWIVTGRTTASSPSNELLLKNGYIAYRGGMSVGGHPIVPPLLAATMNESGDIAMLWGLDSGGYGLFLNDQLLAKIGDSVVFASPPSPPLSGQPRITGFGGADSLAISGRDAEGKVAVYANAFLDTTGTLLHFDDFGVLLRIVGDGPGSTPCYANCDGSTTPPILNVDDFTCFITRFSAGDPWANCDGSTVEPVLNVDDFTCFIERFAAGCD